MAASGSPTRMTIRSAALVHAADDRKRIVIGLDQFQRVLGDIAARRDDHGDRLADVAHALLCDRRLKTFLQRFARRKSHGDAAKLVEIRGRIDGEHARHRACRVGSDRANARVGLRAAQDRRIRHVRELDVGRIFARAREETAILLPRPCLPDIFEAHAPPPFASVVAASLTARMMLR
jgi:hypothetical protein